MRILYVSPYPPARDGIGDYTAALARGLRERGHEVAVVAPRRLAGAGPEVLAALPADPGRTRELADLVAGGAPDVVHVQFAVAAFTTRIPSLLALLGHLRRRGPAIFVTLHEVLRDTAQTRAPGRALYRRLAGLADCVILHTEAARAALAGPVGARADHVSVVPHPRARLPAAQTTPAELRRRHGLGADPVLLAFGFVHVDKGLDDLVRAYARLRRRGRHGGARLVVAGAVRPRQGPFRAFEVRDRLHLARMRRLVRAARLQDRVTFTGYVPGGEVRPWFELAAAAVLPYRRIDQSGVAGLAGAAGTPVLLSTAGGLAEAEAVDWTFPPRAPERLAGVLEAFLAAAPEGRAGAAPAVTAPDVDGFVRATLTFYAPVRREGEEVIHAVPA